MQLALQSGIIPAAPPFPVLVPPLAPLERPEPRVLLTLLSGCLALLHVGLVLLAPLKGVVGMRAARSLQLAVNLADHALPSGVDVVSDAVKVGQLVVLVEAGGDHAEHVVGFGKDQLGSLATGTTVATATATATVGGCGSGSPVGRRPSRPFATGAPRQRRSGLLVRRRVGPSHRLQNAVIIVVLRRRRLAVQIGRVRGSTKAEVKLNVCHACFRFGHVRLGFPLLSSREPSVKRLLGSRLVNRSRLAVHCSTRGRVGGS
mmetsp:Transcript_18428/g.54579  ORF Transcript_18428/g.54579 Transcript_18428/m.54579 type:complete len:260 (-) Transcript_18428:83-862(-)